MEFAASVIGLCVIVAILTMIRIVKANQVGLVFLFGVYVTTLRPGFNLVTPLAKVRRVTPGSGPNSLLGFTGIAEGDLDPQSPTGSVQIGDRRILARPQSRIPAGARVTVIEDVTPGVVLVAMDRRGTAPRLLQ